MQLALTALLPLLSLLAASPAQAAHDSSDALSRRHHARHAQAMAADAMKHIRREDIDASVPRAHAKRVVKRGANGCRVKGSNPTFAAAVNSTTASVTGATTSPGNAGAAFVAQATTTTKSSGAATASPSPAAASTSSASTGGGSNSGSFSSWTINGIKAGMSLGDAVPAMGSHISWWYNWDPTDDGQSFSGVQYIPMIWGNGQQNSQDSSRFSTFTSLSNVGGYLLGPYEPDCNADGMSSGMGISATAALWNQYIGPRKAQGTQLLSPSMCKQKDENGWLKQFLTEVTVPFDALNIHINKNSLAGVQADIDYYSGAYPGYAIWVSEFACVDDSNGFTPCTDQTEINNFINAAVDWFEQDSRVQAYAYSNGAGLGDVWPAWSNGALSQSGQTYLNAISKYH